MVKKIKLSDSNYRKVGRAKVSTIRLGVKQYCLGSTDIVNVDTGEHVPCLITEIKLLKVRDLDYGHAIRDEFNSLGELMRELRKIYTTIHPDDKVTVVKFHCRKPR